MKEINTYILEKLHLDKNIDVINFAEELFNILFTNKFKYKDEVLEIFDNYAKDNHIFNFDDLNIYAEENDKNTLSKLFKDKKSFFDMITFIDRGDIVKYYKEIQHEKYRVFNNQWSSIYIYIKEDTLIFFEIHTPIHLTFKLKQ